MCFFPLFLSLALSVFSFPVFKLWLKLMTIAASVKHASIFSSEFYWRIWTIFTNSVIFSLYVMWVASYFHLPFLNVSNWRSLLMILMRTCFLFTIFHLLLLLLLMCSYLISFDTKLFYVIFAMLSSLRTFWWLGFVVINFRYASTFKSHILHSSNILVYS